MWAELPNHDWIDAVCRQYSRALGCALTFERHDEQVHSRTPDAPSENGVQWRTAISDGTQTIGVLRLRGKAGHQRDAEFLQACGAAELTARLIEQVLTTRAADAFDAYDLSRISEHPEKFGLQFDPVRADGGADPKTVAARSERLLAVIRRLTGFPAAALFVRDPETSQLECRAIQAAEALNLNPLEIPLPPVAYGDGPSPHPLIVVRRSVDPAEQWNLLPPDFSTVAIQFIGQSPAAKGAVWLLDRRDRRLSNRDRHMLARLAARFEQLLEQAKVLDESFDNRKLKGELRAASRTQPAAEIQFTAPDGWCEVAGCMHSVRGIGGDLCEIIPLANDRLFIAIGDAAGHSIPAAMVMANVRGVLRTLMDCPHCGKDLPRGIPPHEVLARTNTVLHGIVQSHQFMTLFCGILDRDRLTFEFANAGHPQPLLLRDGIVVRLESHGIVLGVTDQVTYSGAAVELQAGDVLTFYTDGVTEALCSARTQFGAERIEDTIRQHGGRSAIEIRDQLWSAMHAHLAGSRQNDDRTLAIVRLTPHAVG